MFLDKVKAIYCKGHKQHLIYKMCKLKKNNKYLVKNFNIFIMN